MHYIYHIPERSKIGVTSNLKDRERRHKTKLIILEEHVDAQTAGDRERELQDEYGYPKDRLHYTQTLARPTFEGRQKAGLSNRALTMEQAIELRELHASGKRTRWELVEDFGIAYSTVCNIIKGLKYKR